MQTIKATHARSNFFQMLSDIQNHGTSFEIIRNNLPVAELKPINPQKRLGKFFGIWSGLEDKKFADQLLVDIKRHRQRSKELVKPPLKI